MKMTKCREKGRQKLSHLSDEIFGLTGLALVGQGENFSTKVHNTTPQLLI